MGVHGAEIFDDDVALDVQTTFEEALAEGASVRAATRHVLDEYEESLDDPDDGAIVWLALAALQVEQGALQPRVRRHALAVLATGNDLARWEEVGEEAVAERRQVLAALQARLEAPLAAPRA